MRKVMGNDIAEGWLESKDFTPLRVIWHERVRLDTRGDLMMKLITAWGGPAALADAMIEAHQDERRPHQSSKAHSPIDIVIRAAEFVDAVWFEAERRGWLLKCSSLDELQEP